MSRSGSIPSLLREGIMFQVGGAASVLRDNLHVIVVGPIYGATWVGYYAWSFQLCTIASQAFVQISARVSLSVTAKAPDFPSRWAYDYPTNCNADDRHSTHLACGDSGRPRSRSVPVSMESGGLRLTYCRCCALGCCLASHAHPLELLCWWKRALSHYARALWAWTGAEIAAAYLAVLILGPYGLALSYSLTAWVGIYLLLTPLNATAGSLFRQVYRTIFARPGLWVSIVTALGCVACTYLSGQPIPIALAVGALLCVLCAYLIDPDLRFLLLHKGVN